MDWLRTTDLAVSEDRLWYGANVATEALGGRAAPPSPKSSGAVAHQEEGNEC